MTSHRKITSNEIFFTTIHQSSCWEQLFGEHVSHCVEGKVAKSKNVTNIFFFIQHINEEAIDAKPVNLVNLGLVKESFRYYFSGKQSIDKSLPLRRNQCTLSNDQSCITWHKPYFNGGRITHQNSDFYIVIFYLTIEHIDMLLTDNSVSGCTHIQ